MLVVAVLSFTIVCLAMAGQFQHVLAASDLSEWVSCSDMTANLQIVLSSFCTIRHLCMLGEPVHCCHSVRIRLIVFNIIGLDGRLCCNSLGCSFILKERNPISTRIELACLGLAGTFWLGEYLALL